VPNPPAVGATYTYSGETAIGVGPGSLAPGTPVRVREVVPADVPGAHDDTEDAVVIEWDEEDAVVTDVRTEPYVETVPRLAAGGGVATDDKGNPIMDERNRSRVVPVLGRGPCTRAMSIGAEQFATDFTEG
jgi:hypothetical protein